MSAHRGDPSALSKRRCCSVPSSTRSASAGRRLGSVPAPSGAARFARRRHHTGSCAHLRRPAMTAGLDVAAMHSALPAAVLPLGGAVRPLHALSQSDSGYGPAFPTSPGASSCSGSRSQALGHHFVSASAKGLAGSRVRRSVFLRQITRVSGPGWVMTDHPAQGQGAHVMVESGRAADSMIISSRPAAADSPAHPVCRGDLT